MSSSVTQALHIAILMVVLLGSHQVANAQPLPTIAVTKTSTGQTSNAHSSLSDMTPDGQTIIYTSTATDIAPNSPTFSRAASDHAVFAYDRLLGTSVELTPGVEGVVSNDGRHVIFSSHPSNLVSNDTNDVFSFDRSTGQIRLLSTNEFGNPANGASSRPAISGDGRHVVFASTADNLDLSSGLMRGLDLYALDRDPDGNGIFDEATTLRPRRMIPAAANLSLSGTPRFSASLSFDGRYVAFTAPYEGITAGSLVGYRHLYLHDRDADDDGVFDEPGMTNYYLLATDNPDHPSLSDNGRYLAFGYYGANALATTVPGCEGTPGCRLFVLDLDTNNDGTIDPATAAVRAALQPNLLPGDVNQQNFPRLSASGRYLSYRQEYPNSSALRPKPQVFWRDLDTGSERVVSVSQTQREANKAPEKSIPDDSGRFVAFGSPASNLVPYDVNRAFDVFLSDALGMPPASPISGECDDQTDNDDDVLIDLNDPGCRSPDDQREDRVAGTVVTRPVLVTPIAEQIGNATIVDAQGDTGQNPSFDILFHGGKYIAYTSKFYNAQLGIFEDRLRLARHYGVYWETETLSPNGIDPSLAIDKIQYVHTAFYDPVNQDLMYARNTTTIGDSLEVLESDGDTGRIPSLVVDSMDVPWIVYQDVTRRQIRLRSPSVSASETVVSDIDVCALDTDITQDDRLLIAYVDCDTGELTVVRANFSGGLEASAVVDSGPVAALVAIASDTYGVPHVTYSTIGNAPDPVRYAYETGSGWVTQQVPSDSIPTGLDIIMTLGIDANLVFNDGSGMRRFKFAQSFVFDQKPFAELEVPAIVGDAGDLSVALDPDDNLQLAYYDRESLNLLQVDTVATPWRTHVVAGDPNSGLRDLEFESSRQGVLVSSQAPKLLTFSSPISGGVGQLLVKRRFPIALDWLSTPIAAAAPQDSADMSPNGGAVASFDNVNGMLRLYTEDAAGAWSEAPAVAQLPQFEWLDNVTVFNRPASGGLAITAVHRGNEDSGDILTVFRGSGPFTEHPLPFFTSGIGATSSAIGGDTIYVAYIDQNVNELHLATFMSGAWQDELVDDGDGFSLGNSLSLQLGNEQLRAESGQPPRSVRVPTIAYYNASTNRVRYASRVTGWEYFEYDQAIPGLHTVRHVVDIDSRRKPVILTASSDGTVKLLRHRGDTDLQAAIEEVTDEHDGSGEIDFGLSPTAAVAFAATDGTIRYAVSGGASALPAARSRAGPGGSAPTQDICFPSDDDSKLFQSSRSAAWIQRKALPQPVPVTIDEEPLRRWEIQFARTAAGQDYIDFFRRDYPKMARLMAADPGLFFDATDVLQNFMPGIRAMVDGNGDQALLTQAMMDSALDIWQRLSDRDSGSLSAFIEAELLRWNDLQDFVDMTYEEWGLAIGLDVSAVGAGGDLLFSDSFEN